MGALKLLKNVDLTKKYNNTFTFDTESAQSAFFSSKSVWERTGNIQRLSSPHRVSVNAEELRGVNYMMFQNNGKWYYAFVDEIQYISPNNSKVFFTIDVWQTWYFEMEFEHCYVEREHVADDTIGEHLLNEDLDIGDVIVRDIYEPVELQNLTYVLMTSVDADLNDVVGDEYAGVYSGLKFFASDSVTFVNNVITTLNNNGKGDALVALFMMAKSLVPVVNDGTDQSVVPNNAGVQLFDGVNKNESDIDGYVPRNNKLFTYPYNYLEVTNYSGQSNIYPYEYFDSPDCQFSITGDIAPGATAYIEPYDYKGQVFNEEEFMTLGPYPLCVWKYDVYANWLAQNQISNAVKSIGAGASLVGGIATMNPIAVGGGALGVASVIGSFKEKSILPDTQRGNSSGTGAVAAGKMNFGMIKKNIRSEYAKMIDDYFTRFGYKVNDLKIPNFETRPYYNYIKCREVNVFGDVPRNDLEKIRNTLLEGITFWHGDYVGDYSLNNSV